MLGDKEIPNQQDEKEEDDKEIEWPVVTPTQRDDLPMTRSGDITKDKEQSSTD